MRGVGKAAGEQTKWNPQERHQARGAARLQFFRLTINILIISSDYLYYLLHADSRLISSD